MENDGLVRESPHNDLNSGLGIIVICPDTLVRWVTNCFTPGQLITALNYEALEDWDGLQLSQAPPDRIGFFGFQSHP